MQSRELGVVIGLSIFCAICITACVVLPLYVFPCHDGYTYDEELQQCRVACLQEGTEQGLRYNYTSNKCECPDYAPVYDDVNKICVPKCNPGETYDTAVKACIAMPPPSCSPAPSVESATGTVLYPTHFARADTSTTTDSETCALGTFQELTALCTASGYAAYDAQTGKCYNTADCDAQPCTASYCTNATVKAALGEIKKQLTDYNTCENPTEAQVESMCKQQPANFWKSPNCYKWEMQNTIVMTVSPTTPPSTYAIYATLTHPLLNVGDSPVSYNFRLYKPTTTTTTQATASVEASVEASAEATTGSDATQASGEEGEGEKEKEGEGAVKWLHNAEEGVSLAVTTVPAFPSLTLPSLDEPDSVVPLVAATAASSTASTTMTLVKSGIVTVISSCPNPAENTSCVNVVMYLSGSTPLGEGSYTIQIDGRPAWNSSGVLYQLTDPNGISMYLLPAQNGPGVTSALNPVLSAEKAQELANNQAWVNATLTTLSASYSSVVQTPTSDTKLAYVEPTSSEDTVLLVGCTPAYCKATTNQVRHKMIVLAWNQITASQVASANCKTSSGQPVTYVKYMLLRAATNNSAGGAVSYTELIGPSSQPLSSEVISFVDVLPINTTAQYILAAYLVTSATDTASYGNALCKSQQIYASVNVGDYSAAFCHGIKGPQPFLLPPWYWRDPSTGMCQWTENMQGARDYYCMFEYGTDNNPAANFDASRLTFATSTQTCAAAKKQYAMPSTVWSEPYCTPQVAGGNYPDSVCITGYSQNQQVKATCSKQIQAGDMISESDFKRRLDQVVNFYNTNNTYAGTETAVKSITGADTQAAVWATYNKCGPSLQPSTWGMDPAACGDDPVCKQYAVVAGCDRNYCQPWVEQGTGSGVFLQNRACYPPASMDGNKSMCCNRLGTYELHVDRNSTRGECTNCGKTYSGAQCTETACTGQYCSGHGTCVVDQTTGLPRCECEPNYFNVSQQRAMQVTKEGEDCDFYPGGCQWIIADSNGNPVRNSQCLTDPRRCRCPEVKEDLLACRQNSDPKDTSKDPRTGCYKQCGYGIKSSPSNPYTYREPEINDFVCVKCLGDGEGQSYSPEPPYLSYCCSRKMRKKCVNHYVNGSCKDHIYVCDGWNPQE